jgi:DNA-binding response OmpR family regulator
VNLPAKGAQRVLVVEDEPDIAALIAYQLTREGFRVETAATGTEALAAVGREVPDLLVLDRMLPELSGDEVLQALRREKATKSVPVLVLTAKRQQEDRIQGLELGADDYLTKPFSPRELVLRVQAILRRFQDPASEGSGRILRVGPISLDVGSHQVSLDETEVFAREGGPHTESPATSRTGLECRIPHLRSHPDPNGGHACPSTAIENGAGRRLD